MTHANLAGKRVLVVEDEMLVAMLVEDVLQEAGCVVIGPFARVPAGLAAAKVEQVDVALLDVNIANEQVFPIAYALEDRGIPFLFVTGYGEAALPRDRPHWEACTKPFDPVQLATRLSRKIGEGRRYGGVREATDGTGRVEGAKAVLSAEEKLRLATEAADIGWWDVEQGHGRLFWPPRVKAMFGISPDAEVSMDDFYAGLHPDDRDAVAATYAGAADPARRALYDVEYRTIGKEDGVLRWVAAKGRGVFDDTGQCVRVIGTAIDITERKQAQEERLARQLEEAELREQFIAVLGHDLRNPLASVAAGTRFLVRHPERAAEIAEQMQRSIARMSALIENVLDFARGRLGGGFVTTRDDEKPLTPVLLQVIDELRSVHPERSVVVDIDLEEPVTCDRQRIGQLLSNLLGNAFVYGTETAPIVVRARAEDGQLELSVCNSGDNIEPSALERLFQPFFRGKVRGSREGLGLGLYICSEIAKAHGGTLSVISNNGSTCFTLRMPTAAA